MTIDMGSDFAGNFSYSYDVSFNIFMKIHSEFISRHHSTPHVKLSPQYVLIVLIENCYIIFKDLIPKTAFLVPDLPAGLDDPRGIW